MGEIQPQDTSIAVSGLQPDHGYVVRVLAVNSTNFVAASDQISILTKDTTSNDFFSSIHVGEPHVDDPAGPVVKPYKALFDTSTPSQPTIPMQREYSSSISHPKRTIPSRRHTQTGPSLFNHIPINGAESEEEIRKLTDELDIIREEKEALAIQVKSEEERFQTEYTQLTTQLHDIQHQMQEKSNVSRELQKQVALLQSDESTARKNKAAADKKLSQALQEREKMKSEIRKWEDDAPRIEEQMMRIASEQTQYEAHAAEQVRDLKAKLAEESTVNKTLEDGLRQTVAQIKELEEEKRKIDETRHHMPTTSPEGQISDADYAAQLLDLQQMSHYQNYHLTQVKAGAQAAHSHLDYWKSLYYNSGQAYPAAPAELASPRRESLRRRAPSLGSARGIPSYDMSSVFGNTLNGSPGVGNSSHFYTPSTGVGPLSNMLAMSPTDVESLTGGAPTSPSAADNLLPSGLFRDDSESRFGDIDRSRSHSIHDSPSLITSLPGLGAPEALEYINNGPSSPASLQSRSPSVFTSPRESTTHLPGNFMDSDRRSIRSTTGSARAGSGSGTRFTSLFGLGRPKAKPSTDLGPALGSLEDSESHSFPRQDLLDSSEPAPPSPRRRGSHSGLGFVGQILGRSNTSASLDQPPVAKRRLGMFSLTKNDPWAERTDSPRPGSTASSENHLLPRPSAETQSRFGWPIFSGDMPTNRSSPLGSDWGLAPPSNSWAPSRLHSRHASSQHALTLENSVEEPEPSPVQAPIGTRPQSAHVGSSHSSSSAKLNPAAPDFKLLFNKSADKKSEKSGKSKKKDKSKQNDQRESHESDDRLSSSRISRDAMSVSTIDYNSDTGQRESFEFAGSSATPSEAGGLAHPKESFMQKLSRKSSAGFTTLAGRNKARNRSNREDAVDGVADEDSSRLATSTLSSEDTGAPSPSLSAPRSFKFRSLRRRKADRVADGDVEEFDGELEEKEKDK